jgi:hypothetical protein
MKPRDPCDHGDYLLSVTKSSESLQEKAGFEPPEHTMDLLIIFCCCGKIT